MRGQDHGLFQVAHPLMEVLPVSLDVKDRIDDELMWTMKRDIAATVCPDHLDAASLVLWFWKEKVFVMEPCSKGHDGIVLDEQKRVRRPLDDTVRDGFLDIPSWLVRHATEIDDAALHAINVGFKTT